MQFLDNATSTMVSIAEILKSLEVQEIGSSQKEAQELQKKHKSLQNELISIRAKVSAHTNSI